MSRISRTARLVLPLVALFTLLGALGARPALAAGVVGNGNPASCTELAFDTALAGGGSVTFNCGPNPISISLSALKNININTTIDGAHKITLDAGNTFHFQVQSGATLNLKNIRLTGGLSNAAGSIENFGTLKTNFVTFHKNESTVDGGAIVNYGEIKINNTTFTKNKSVSAGGAIINEGGNIKIKNSKFKANKATHAASTGGAIYNKSGDVDVKSSSFTKNRASNGGGYMSEYDSTNSIKNSTFIKNFAASGAGITNYGGMQLVLDTIAGNIADSQGGGIFHAGSLSISQSTIRDNRAIHGGGMRHFGNSLFIDKTTFYNNTASLDGGGVYASADTEVWNSTFSSNDAGAAGGGGAWFQYRNTTVFKFVTFADNTADYGGGVYGDGTQNPEPEIHFQNSVLSNNIGGNCSGAIISSLGYNVSSDTYCSAFTQTGDKQNKNANLGPLANNGGPTWTHLPLLPSPLINKGLNDANIPTDQRNAPRPVGPKSDIGAVEVQ